MTWHIYFKIHLVISYLGHIGYIMGGSGLRNLWETAYAHNSVNHMFTGHAYARALGLCAHMLSAVSLGGVYLNKVKYLHEMLLKHACLSEVLSKEHVLT